MQKYNSKSTYVITSEMKAKYPALCADKGSLEFAECVKQIQRDYDLLVDGKLGLQTYSALTSDVQEHILHNSLKIPMPKSHVYDLITYDEPNGYDLHRFGNFSKRKKPITSICIHWGGLNAQHCYNVMGSTSRKVSTHFLIDVGVVYQVLDLKYKAWHAGKHNETTIGIDICQQASTKWKDHYDLPIIDNPTSRGDKKIIAIDDKLAETVRAFTRDLQHAMNLMNILVPDASGLYDPADYTLYSHSHLTKRKWDIACWWDRIFNEN